MTAPFSGSDDNLPDADAAIRRVDDVCCAATHGRSASRALAQWCRRFELNEPEFQVLWLLRDNSANGVDQTTLSQRLVSSPAQMSSVVERCAARGWIARQPSANDRRRHLWYLSAAGHSVVIQMLLAADELVFEGQTRKQRLSIARSNQEAA